MTTRPQFLSRRVILRLMGATPISVAASSAYAHPAGDCDRLPDKQGLKFGLVAARLWEAFLNGVDIGGAQQGKAVTVRRNVFEMAARLSGVFVLRSLDRFDPNGDHADVYRCCVACGIAAARRAILADSSNPVIDKDVFHDAWCDTKACYNNAVCKTKFINPLPNNPSTDPFPIGPDCPIPSLDRMGDYDIRSVGCG